MDVPGHDADLDFVRRDHAGAIRSQKQRLFALHLVARADHIAHRDALGNTDNQVEPRVDRLVDRRSGKRRGHVDHADRRPGRLLGFGHGCVNGNALEVLARFLGIDAGDEAILPVRVVATHAGVELPGLAGDSLRDDFGVFVYQDAHGLPSFPRKRESSVVSERYFHIDHSNKGSRPRWLRPSKPFSTS